MVQCFTYIGRKSPILTHHICNWCCHWNIAGNYTQAIVNNLRLLNHWQNAMTMTMTSNEQLPRRTALILSIFNNQQKLNITRRLELVGEAAIGLSSANTIYCTTMLKRKDTKDERIHKLRHKTSPQSNLRRARRSSAHKTNSKLLGSHSPSMLTPLCAEM